MFLLDDSLFKLWRNNLMRKGRGAGKAQKPAELAAPHLDGRARRWTRTTRKTRRTRTTMMTTMTTMARAAAVRRVAVDVDDDDDD